jgi:hypothetical protein
MLRYKMMATENLKKYLTSLIFFFAEIENSTTFAIPNGSLAQLVQSICLTSRGSGVRTPQLPLKESHHNDGFLFFSCPKYKNEVMAYSKQ